MRRYITRWNECDVCHGAWGNLVVTFGFFARFGHEQLCSDCTRWAEGLGVSRNADRSD